MSADASASPRGPAPMPPPPPSLGLTTAEVQARRAQGQVNRYQATTSRTVQEIVRSNVLTRFNALLGGLLVVILIVGPFQDALFGLTIVANTLIGTVQELRTKRTLDKLAILTVPRVEVVRDGKAKRDRRQRHRPGRRGAARGRRPGGGRRAGADVAGRAARRVDADR